MIDIGIPLAIGNVLLLISSAPLIWALYKDRNAVKGISPSGAVLNFFALLAFDIFYVISQQWISLILNIPIVVFWLMASIYTIKKVRGGEVVL
jgi:hypothetical protein